MGRDEFLTSYVGEAFADHGKWQAQFEYASCIAELLEMDAVNTPTYDWGMAAATAIRMGARITGRSEALVSAAHQPRPALLHAQLRVVHGARPSPLVEHDPATGLLDLDDLKAKMTDKVAVVYFENPSFLGVIEHQGAAIADIVHGAGGVVAAGVDPISLGVLEAPANYGVDIAVRRRAGPRHPHAVRRRPGRLHRHPGRARRTSPSSTPSCSASRRPSWRASTASARSSSSAPRTRRARRPRTSSAPWRSCTASAPASTSRSWARRA